VSRVLLLLSCNTPKQQNKLTSKTGGHIMSNVAGRSRVERRPIVNDRLTARRTAVSSNIPRRRVSRVDV